jgi:hypothetical protein
VSARAAFRRARLKRGDEAADLIEDQVGQTCHAGEIECDGDDGHDDIVPVCLSQLNARVNVVSTTSFSSRRRI